MTEATDGEENQPGNIKKIEVGRELDLLSLFLSGRSVLCSQQRAE
jgi:hypothetical protein